MTMFYSLLCYHSLLIFLVTNTREGVLDSHLLRTVSYIGEEKVRSLTTNLLKFAPCLFAEKVVSNTFEK